MQYTKIVNAVYKYKNEYFDIDKQILFFSKPVET